jgi:uncharacterized protein YehS (DUF1456 family)
VCYQPPVTHNDVLRGIRYLLNVSDAKLVEITALGGREIAQDDIVAYLKKEEEAGYRECPALVMAHFLNGLVVFKRGKDESRPPQPVELPVTNNVVLKKIRVAFQLKDTDLIALIEKSGTLKITKTELSAFFRSRGHRNYRECGDQYLRNLLKALSL